MPGSNQGVTDTNQGVPGSNRGVTDTNQGVPDLNQGVTDSPQRDTGLQSTRNYKHFSNTHLKVQTKTYLTKC